MRLTALPSDRLLLSSFMAHGFVVDGNALPSLLCSQLSGRASGCSLTPSASGTWSGVGGGLDCYDHFALGTWLARRCGGE